MKIDPFIIGIIIFITVDLIAIFFILKRFFAGAATKMIEIGLKNPELFKKDMIDESVQNKEKIVNELKNFDQIKKTKILESHRPLFVIDITVLCKDGIEHNYRATTKVTGQGIKILDLTKYS